MRDNFTKHFVGLDIGTSQVRCVVGMIDPETNTPSIIGHGSAENLGMRRGVVVHPDDVAAAIGIAVEEAERISGFHIKEATLNINGSHVAGIDSQGVIAISSANREITTEDRNRVEEAAAIMQLPPNREIIQVFAKNYRVDGQDSIKEPVGMRGVRLEADTHIVTVSTPVVRNLYSAIDKAGVVARHRTIGGLAAAEAVLNRQQKESGTLLLDIGAGTTNLVVVEDGEVQHVAVIPMGGVHITNDLAIGLKTDLNVAETVKVKYANLGGSIKSNKVQVSVDGVAHSFDPEEIQMIVEARVEEILEFVDKELKKIHKSRKLPGGVVIVGGSSSLPGLAEFTKEKLELAARIGSLQPLGGLLDTVQDQSYITTIGLMLLDMLLSDHHNHNNYGGAAQGLFGLITGTLGRFKSKKK